MARIFVVEDDASLREELMRLLELQGHTALTGTAFDRIVDDVWRCARLRDPRLKLPGTGGHTSAAISGARVKCPSSCSRRPTASSTRF